MPDSMNRAEGIENIGKRRVVVLGGGFAAYRFVRELGSGHYDATLVAPRNHFLFTPLLPSTTVGTLEFRSILEPLRRQNNAEFRLLEAQALDRTRRVVSGISPLDGRPAEIAYDDLIIAVGAVPGTFGVPGVADHAIFLKEIRDARVIRRRVLDGLEMASAPGLSAEERARLLTFVVVGGGPTGVEFAAELHDFLMSDLMEAYPAEVPHARIILLEALPKLLGAFDQSLSDYTARHFHRSNIDVRTGARVVNVAADRLALHDGSEIAFGLLVWATGNAPTAFVKSLDLPKDGAGRLLVGPDLKVKGEESIYALGDCSLMEAAPLPATGQVAEQQGRYLGEVFRNRAHALSKNKEAESGQNFKPTKPFVYKRMGMLAYVGGNRAVADLPGIKASGFVTFVFWRSVYLSKLVSVRNRILVLFDWVKSHVLGRDLSRF
jgi:NADH:ubiquinone reductase (non-electrogenic)